MKTILTFGDSNTYGAIPVEVLGQGRRLGPDARWPGVMHKNLGSNWELFEEGLPGRTTKFEDEVMGRHMDGALGLPIALQSKGPIDVLTLMLGTNDLKSRFKLSAREIAGAVGELADICLDDEMQDRHGGFKILLISPPPVHETGVFVDQFAGAAEISKALASSIKAEADARGLAFLDAGEYIESSRVDGIHFDETAHSALGEAVANAVKSFA